MSSGPASTLVISDLHLGRLGGEDVLQRPAARAALLQRLSGVDRLVLLGDTLELRQGPAREALRRAASVLRDLGAAMAGRPIIVVPGNHDHELAADWHARRHHTGAGALGLEQRIAPADGSWIAEQLAAALAPADVELAYPGIWLRDDVYAMHGHYLDVHSTIPTFERLAAGATARITGAVPEAARPDDYERVLAPNYAWSHAVAQWAAPARGQTGSGAAVRVYRRLAGDGSRPIADRVLAAAFGLAVLAVNRTGIGPVRADVSASGLLDAVLDATGEAAERLGVGATHVIFGHSHRAGPLPGDDVERWRRRAILLHNCGCWVYEPHFLGGADGAGPYWPGSAIAVDTGARSHPRVERLLTAVGREALRPGSAPAAR